MVVRHLSNPLAWTGLLLFFLTSFKLSLSFRRFRLMFISFLSNRLCAYDICRFTLKYLSVIGLFFYFILTYLLFLLLKSIVIACEFILSILRLYCFEMRKCLKYILKFHLNFLFFNTFFVNFKILRFHFCLYVVKCILLIELIVR